jgi:phage gp36-like protein
MYASLTDFKQHYQEKGIEIAVSDQRLLDELKSAASEIDLYLTNVYVLPIVVSVPYLRWANCAIASKMLAINGESKKDRADYEDAITTLVNVGLSRVDLVDETGKALPKKSVNESIQLTHSVSSSVGNRRGYYTVF